jgi:proteasome accessory factor C
MRLLVVEGRTYLEGWCRRAEGVRVFRLDRVLAVKVLAVAAEVPREAEPVDVDSGLFRPSPSDLRVVIELSPYGRWVAEYYPCEEVTELGEGRLRVIGWPCGSARTAASSGLLRSLPTSAGRPAPPWPSTEPRAPGARPYPRKGELARNGA